MQPGSSRQAYLDWLRIIAIIGVLFFHSAMPYVAEWQWHLKNRETSNLLLEFNAFLHRFRMPLLFFISGTVSYFMLQKKTAGGFIGLRFRRLMIPLLFGMLVVVPPQVYMERLSKGFTGNYFDFYKTVFNGVPYPKGNLSWHHLWFILYLFLYDVACAPLFTWLTSSKGKSFLQRANWLCRGNRIFLIMIPGVLVYTFLSLKFPETNDLVHDLGYLPYWLCFLLAGFLCIANPVFMDALESNRRRALMMAFISIVFINYLRWNKLEPWDQLPRWQSHWQTYAYMALQAVCAWTWVFTAIGYGKRYLNRKHKVLDYLNQAVYPFYILHQTVIVIIVYYVIQVNEGIGMKYLFTVIVSFLLSMALFHLFIRPFPAMRLLFGMKPKQAIQPGSASREEQTAKVLQPAL